MKIVQIFFHHHMEGTIMFALREDGTLWWRETVEGTNTEWHSYSLPAFPDTSDGRDGK